MTVAVALLVGTSCAEARPPGAAVAAELADGELLLHAPDLDVSMSDVRDPWAAPRAGFYLHVRAVDRRAWSGSIGLAPILEPPEDEPFVVARIGPQAWVFASGWDSARRAVVSVRDDGVIAVTTDGQTRAVAVGDPDDFGLGSWYAAREEALLEEASRHVPGLIATNGYSYAGVPLTDCALLAEDCDVDRLVVSCRAGANQLVRVRIHREPWVDTRQGGSPYLGASRCARGPAGIPGPPR